MSERSDQLTNDAITQFLRSRSADPDLRLLDDIVRTVAATPQVRPWLGLRSMLLPRRTLLIVASALLVATMGSIGVGSRFLQPDPLLMTFGGAWVSTSDADGGTQTMSVGFSADGAVDIIVHDTIASVCSSTPSTMTGTGTIGGGTRLVIPAPVYACDDGSEPQALSGPPLEEQLRNWTLTLDSQTGTLTDNFGAVWHREGVAVPSPESSSGPTASSQRWPQSSLEEVREAQELADAGDPRYTWQVDPQLDGDAAPWGAEIFTRFIEDELGWEQFIGGWGGSGYLSMGAGGGVYEGVVFIRCAPGEMNPLSSLYADVPPEIRGCAPTIDELSYETVSVDVSQPVRRGPEGIWVVDRWELRQSKSSDPNSLWGLLYPEMDGQVAQVVPPSDAEVTALVQAFLGARVEGEGAEQYLVREPEASPFEDREVPLLYATTSGAPYERSEIEHVQGPVWPTGWSEFKVRLFAEGETLVEQYFHVVRNDGRLGLVYGHASNNVPTTENGQSVAVPFSELGGTVTFTAAPPLGPRGDGSIEIGLTASGDGRLIIAADPHPDSCADGPAPADAEALARSIMAVADFETTQTVPAPIAGTDGLQMDVTFSEENLCYSLWMRSLPAGDPGWRMRLYLIDYPESAYPPGSGWRPQVLTMAVIAPQTDFERVLEEAAPIVESLEFRAP